MLASPIDATWLVLVDQWSYMTLPLPCALPSAKPPVGLLSAIWNVRSAVLPACGHTVTETYLTIALTPDAVGLKLSVLTTPFKLLKSPVGVRVVQSPAVAVSPTIWYCTFIGAVAGCDNVTAKVTLWCRIPAFATTDASPIETVGNTVAALPAAGTNIHDETSSEIATANTNEERARRLLLRSPCTPPSPSFRKPPA